MKIKYAMVVFFLFYSFLLNTFPGQDQQPIFRVEVRQVNLPVIALRRGSVETELKKENLKIFLSKDPDNKHTWEEVEIKNFLTYEERPVALFFAIDISRSVESQIANQIVAADQFLTSLFRLPKRKVEDIATISSFYFRYQMINDIRPPNIPEAQIREGRTINIGLGNIFNLTSLLKSSVPLNRIALVYDGPLTDESTLRLPPRNFVVEINGKQSRSINAIAIDNQISIVLPVEVLPSDRIDKVFYSLLWDQESFYDLNQVQQITRHIFDSYQLHENWTSNIESLKNALLSSIRDIGGNTSFFDALYWMGEKFEELDRDYTKIGVVITDGDDNVSVKNAEQSIEKLQKSQAVIFAISVEKIKNKKDLEKITEATGGQLFIETRPERLKSQFDRILEQIRGAYTLSFEEPQAPGKYHIKIEIGEEDKRGRWRTKRGFTAKHPMAIVIE